MKEIMLTQGKVALVDDEDYEWINQWRWCFSGYYAIRSAKVDGKKTMTYMHRVIMDTPDGLQVDHINHERLDNRRENLRNCTNAENMQNNGIRKKNTSGFKCVDLHKNRWRARILVNGSRIELGESFSTPEEAARAYDLAAKEYLGDFAVLNFP